MCDTSKGSNALVRSHSVTCHPTEVILTVALWVQLSTILCQTGLSRHLQFLTSGRSDAQG